MVDEQANPRRELAFGQPLDETEWKRRFVAEFLNLTTCTEAFAGDMADASWDDDPSADPETYAQNEASYAVEDAKMTDWAQ